MMSHGLGDQAKKMVQVAEPLASEQVVPMLPRHFAQRAVSAKTHLTRIPIVSLSSSSWMFSTKSSSKGA